MSAVRFMRDFLAAECLLVGETMRLSAGGTASFYFDCKRATLNGKFLECLADWLLDDVAARLSLPPTAVGGPTLGADSITAAVAMRAHQRGLSLTHGCIIRKDAKQHGTQNKIENEPPGSAHILVVEDVITTGKSIALACDEVLAAGHQIAAIAAIIDRETGGKQALAERYGVPVYALFDRGDFPESA